MKHIIIIEEGEGDLLENLDDRIMKLIENEYLSGMEISRKLNVSSGRVYVRLKSLKKYNMLSTKMPTKEESIVKKRGPLSIKYKLYRTI